MPNGVVCRKCSWCWTGIATRYGLYGPGFESRWVGRDFPYPSIPALGPTQPPIQRVPCLSRGVKRPGRGADHPPPFSAEVKEIVELYPLLHLCAFVACYGENITFTFSFIDSCCRGQEPIKELFHRYFALLLRFLQADTVEYQYFRGNSYANLCYMFFISCRCFFFVAATFILFVSGVYCVFWNICLVQCSVIGKLVKYTSRGNAP